MHKGLELLVMIVNFGMGSKVVKHGKQFGLAGGTIFLGKGTIKKSLLEFLELNEVRKEIVLMGGAREDVQATLMSMKEKFQLAKPGKGVAMSIPVNDMMGVSKEVLENKNIDKGGKKPMYNLIYVIVDMGKAKDVIEAASKAGSTGATVMTARGSGIHEKSGKLFGMEIEPQKEIVLIISNTEKTGSITDAVRVKLDIDKPGHGVIFTVGINEVHGLYSNEK